MEAIVAVFSDWGIGKDGTQQLVLRADRKHFRDITAHDAVLVGRRTMEDFPGGKPLKDRPNLVLTRQTVDIPGAEVVHSTEEALAAATRYPRCLVIGGAGVYRQMLPWIDRVHVTKILLRPESDSYFPDLDRSSAWRCEEEGPLLEEDGISYRFCTYIRVAPEEE